MTWDTGYSHCGVHAPVRPGGNEIAGAERMVEGRGKGRVVLVVAVVGVVLGGVLI